MRFAFALLIVILWLSNYYICDFFYPENLKGWWTLRTNIYSIVFAMTLQLANHKQHKNIKFVLNIGTGFAISDVIDRVFFNTNEFNYTDIITALLTIAFAIYDYNRNGS